MSLFRVREWWEASCDHEDEFDAGSLCLGNIDNVPSRVAKIIVGSFRGDLRIYGPRQREFHVEDLLLEQNLGQAILQVETGYFTGSRGQLGLAVLHPREVVVYLVSAAGGTADAPGYLSLQRCFSHALERTAANMVSGPFGGLPPGTDSLCVQSMDGLLTVFDREVHAFSRFLPNFLLPGPLCYVRKTDSFVTCNAAFTVECYRYQMLAASSGEGHHSGQGSAGGNAGRRLQPDWSIVIGERALDIQVARFSKALSPAQIDIVVLGERTLFILTEQGALRSQRRLDYHPTAVVPVPLGGDNYSGAASHHLMVATSTGSLMVYSGDNSLVWAAKGESVPVAMRIAEFGGTPGMVVTLEDRGRLSVSYLGTEPPINVVGVSISGKELDYEKLDEEHRKLLTTIREVTSELIPEPADKLVLRAQVPATRDAPSEIGPDEPASPSGRPAGPVASTVTVRVFVAYTGSSFVEDVQLAVSAHPPLRCRDPTVVIPQIGGGNTTPHTTHLAFTATTDVIPSSLSASVVAAYMSEAGEPRTAACNIQLPLGMVCRVVAPVKSADFKVTLDTNRPPTPLTSLFEELVAGSHLFDDASQRAMAFHVLSFHYHSGQDVTILVSKNAGRYRIQSACFEAMGLIASELHRRLTAYFSSLERSKALIAASGVDSMNSSGRKSREPINSSGRNAKEASGSSRVGSTTEMGSGDGGAEGARKEDSSRRRGADERSSAEQRSIAGERSSSDYDGQSEAGKVDDTISKPGQTTGMSGEATAGAEAATVGDDDGGRLAVRKAHDDRSGGTGAVLENGVGPGLGYEPFRMTFEEALPLQEVFVGVDAHFEARQNLSRTVESLGQRAQQFRSIQKRLLVRFRDHNPAPLDHLDTLLTATFQQLMSQATVVEEAQAQLQAAANSLSCSIRFLLLLIRLQLRLDDDNFQALEGYISPLVVDAGEQGWEEATLASTGYLLRSASGRGNGDKASSSNAVTAEQPLATVEDTVKLKKQLTLVCERLGKGIQLVVPHREQRVGDGLGTNKRGKAKKTPS